MKYDVIIVGAGFAGATLANKFSRDNKKVLICIKLYDKSQISTKKN